MVDFERKNQTKVIFLFAHVSWSLKRNMKSLFSLFISHLRHNNTITDSILAQKAIWQNVILDMFSTLLYCFIHLFHHFCEAKALVNPFQSSKHLILMNRGMFSNEIFQLSKSDFQMFCIWAKIFFIQCSMHRMASMFIKLRVSWTFWYVTLGYYVITGTFKRWIK